MYIALFIFVLLGAVPLVITLVKWRKHSRIRRRGIKTIGVVLSKYTLTVKRGRPVDSLQIGFHGLDVSESHRGHVHTAFGKFKVGDTVTLYYLPGNPTRIVVAGALGYGPVLVFFAALFLFVLFAAYKLQEMIRFGGP